MVMFTTIDSRADHSLTNERGVALLTVLSIVLLLTFIGTVTVMTSKTELDISGVDRTEKRAFYAAEAGLEKAIGSIMYEYENYGLPPDPLPNDQFDLDGYTVTYQTVDHGTPQIQYLTHGAYKGLYALVKSFTVRADATGGAYNARAEVVQDVEDALIPLFQFAVFYEDDLEIAPGPNMTLGGRVHTNMDMYLQSNNSLSIDSYTTAAGNIYHGRHPDSGKTDNYGDVLIMDAVEEYENMRNDDGSWLDSRDENWVFSSLQRWDGRVEDSAHGITELYLPVVTAGEPIDLIKRGEDNPDSFEHKAGLKLVDGSAYWKDDEGEWQDVTEDFEDEGILTNGSFFNYREGKWISSYDIDIAELNDSGYFPDNGILYAAHTDDDNGAVRLVAGEELAGPLTVATENPLYTWGDYNSINKQPAALLTDAYNVLSNSWQDYRSTGSLSLRVASNTIVNACFMTGNVPSQSNHYSGGLENLPRFLEKWTGKTFYYRGSMVDLWESEKATGIWYYGGYFYTAPNRDWGFDNMYLDPVKLPPGTPQVNAIQRGQWSHELAQVD
jgi:hypothetical protein